MDVVFKVAGLNWGEMEAKTVRTELFWGWFAGHPKMVERRPVSGNFQIPAERPSFFSHLQPPFPFDPFCPQ